MPKLTSIPADTSKILATDEGGTITLCLTYTPDAPFTGNETVKIRIENGVLTPTTGSAVTTYKSVAFPQFSADKASCFLYVLVSFSNITAMANCLVDMDCVVSVNGTDALTQHISLEYVGAPPITLLEQLSPHYIGSCAALDTSPVQPGATPDPTNNHGVVVQVQSSDTTVNYYTLMFPDLIENNVRCFVYDPDKDKLSDELPVYTTGKPFVAVPLNNGVGYVKFYASATMKTNLLAISIATNVVGIGYIQAAKELLLFRSLDIPTELPAPFVEDMVGHTVTASPKEQGIHVELKVDASMLSALVIPHLYSSQANPEDVFLEPFVIPEDETQESAFLIPYDNFVSGHIYQLDCFAKDRDGNLTKSHPATFMYKGESSGTLPPDVERTLDAPKIFWGANGTTVYDIPFGDGEQHDYINKQYNEDGQFQLTLDVPANVTLTRHTDFWLTGAIVGWNSEGIKIHNVLTQPVPVTDEFIQNRKITWLLPSTALVGYNSDRFGTAGNIWLAGEFRDQTIYSKVWSCRVDTVAPGDTDI